MMPIETSGAIDEIEAGFLYDVTKATVALFYLLQGMEIASRIYIQDPEEHQGTQLAGPILSHLGTFPAVSTTGLDMLGPTGEAVQLAFKGWTADIYNKWEKSRAETRELLGEAGIPVEVDCMGDLRHIRHDLIHSGSASNDHSGKCKVLRWFKPGERIILTTDHVFDFLNQMNMLRIPIVLPNGTNERMILWSLSPIVAKPASIWDQEIRLISLRPVAYEDGEQGLRRYMMSCVFSDGIFGQGEVEVSVEPDEYHQCYINEEGNIAFPCGQVIEAQQMYNKCFDYMNGITTEGPGILGPRARYTKEGYA